MRFEFAGVFRRVALVRAELVKVVVAGDGVIRRVNSSSVEYSSFLTVDSFVPASAPVRETVLSRAPAIPNFAPALMNLRLFR